MSVCSKIHTTSHSEWEKNWLGEFVPELLFFLFFTRTECTKKGRSLKEVYFTEAHSTVTMSYSHRQSIILRFIQD